MNSGSRKRKAEQMSIPFEKELEGDLALDDVQVLEHRYNLRKELSRIAQSIHTSNLSSSSSVEESGSCSSSIPVEPALASSTLRKKSKSHWTRYQDAVQEHFSSHVTLDGVSYRVPNNICALKTLAKQSWILYKKRECERRKRIRIRIEHEKEKERKGEPANVLLSIVDACEYCRKLYVTVNLFWGTTLCDLCYFNPDIIHELMTQKMTAAKNKLTVTSENIVDEIIRLHRKTEATPTPQQPPLLPPNATWFLLPQQQEQQPSDDLFEDISPLTLPAANDSPPCLTLSESKEITPETPPSPITPNDGDSMYFFMENLSNPDSPFDSLDSDIDLHSAYFSEVATSPSASF